MDATQAVTSIVNGNLAGLVEALDASETYTVTGINAEGREVFLGRLSVIGSTLVHLSSDGAITAHGHAEDHEASECAEIAAVRFATLGLLVEAGGRVEVRDSAGNLVPTASVETARMLAMGFPVPPAVMLAEAFADRVAQAPARVAALPLTLGEPGTMDGPPVPPTGMYL
jgi:hypothetical protein